MKARRKAIAPPPPIRRRALVAAGRVMLVVASAALLAATLIVWRLLAASQVGLLAETDVTAIESDVVAVALSDLPTPAADLPPDAPHVGIVAGHAGYDIGAVCPDGMSEAEVNLTVAREVAIVLARRGYRVDLLEEYDDRLAGYQADALISIHADSCDVPGASGFKVARVTDSAIPEAEDRLVACIYQEYEAVTGLPRHPSSITDDMTSYHAFREIDRYTPGAIIETGFLLDDRELLTDRPRQVARGIASGVVCFLEGEE